MYMHAYIYSQLETEFDEYMRVIDTMIITTIHIPVIAKLYLLHINQSLSACAIYHLINTHINI